MITFVYCCICLLIACCHTAGIDSEEHDYNNDSPDTSPQCKQSHYKIGSNISLKCNSYYHNKNTITWEFMPLKNHYRKTHCDNKKLYKLDYGEGQWMKLDFNREKKKLEIHNFSIDNVGSYRCMFGDNIIAIHIVKPINKAKYLGDEPKILSLTPSSNSSASSNTPMVLQCKATSGMPSVIRWFRECTETTTNCSVKVNSNYTRLFYMGYCYCALPSSNYACTNNGGVYLSKLRVYNSPYIESETYVCLVLSEDGADLRNITIEMQDVYKDNLESSNSISLLFLIPVVFVLVPLTIWLGFYKRKKKNRRRINEHQAQLIKPVVEI